MDNKDFMYVCYVQNNLGVLNGEEPISCMIVTKKQEIIDNWLTEQIAEANESGYIPDENVEEFIGKADYYFAVSKGNETEGFESYGFVCRTLVLEENMMEYMEQKRLTNTIYCVKM